MTENAVGWMGLAVINAALANIDRRSPLKYFLGSLSQGPVPLYRAGALPEVIFHDACR